MEYQYSILGDPAVVMLSLRKRLAITGLACVALIACNAPSSSNAGDGTQDRASANNVADDAMKTKAELESAIAAELPKGSSADAVLAFLKARNIEHSQLIDQADQKHMGKNPDEKIISAIIRNTQKGVLVSGNLAITFQFDRDDKLLGSLIENVNTGP